MTPREELEAAALEKLLAAFSCLNDHTKRIEALEVTAKMVRADRSVGHLSERIEQIEKALMEDGVTADGFDKRIRELEGQENALDAAALLELRDRDRQDRWHATRDAFVAGRGPCYARNDAEYAAYTDALHKAAKDFADRAHGPLEGTQEPFSEMDLAAHLRHVEALVKAARVARDVLSDLRSGGDISAAARRGAAVIGLSECLKPFETEHGE